MKLLFLVLSQEKEQYVAKSVIDDYELTDRVFTIIYLYAVKKCQQNAKDNLEYVDRESYTN
jgi:hypothetical protein